MRIGRDSDGRIRWAWRLITYLLAFLAALAFSQNLIPWALQNTPAAVYRPAAAVGQVLTVLGVTWLWRTKLDRRPMADLGLSRGTAGQLALGFGMGMASMVAVALAGAAAGWVRFQGWETASVAWLHVAGGLAVALAPAMATGITEELAMRGYLQTNFSEGRPLWKAVLYTGLIFAVLHAMNFKAVVPYLIFIVAGTVMSIPLSTWRISTGALWVPIGFHAAWNWTQTNVLGFTINQRPDFGHALVHLEIRGPELWLGSPRMPEGGLLTLLVVSVVAVGAVLATRRRIAWR